MIRPVLTTWCCRLVGCPPGTTAEEHRRWQRHMRVSTEHSLAALASIIAVWCAFILSIASGMPTTASSAMDTALAAAAGGGSIAPQVELGIQAVTVFFVWFCACLAVLKAAEALTSPRARRSGRHSFPQANPTCRHSFPFGREGQGASAQARDPSPDAAAPSALSRPRIAKHRSEGDLSMFCPDVPGITRLQRRQSGSFCTAPRTGEDAGDAAEGSSRRRRRASKGSPERAASTSPTAPPQSPSGRLSSGTRFLARSWSAECTWANFLTSSECWRIEEEATEKDGVAKEISAAVREKALLDRKRGSRRCSLRSQSDKLGQEQKFLQQLEQNVLGDMSEARWSNFARSHYEATRNFAAAHGATSKSEREAA